MNATLNRTIAPPTKDTDTFPIQEPKTITLTNGLRMDVINAGSQELCRIEIIFKAGSKFQHKALVANVCNQLLKEGTKNNTSLQIAETIDFYGAFYENECNRDTATVALFCLTKYLNVLLPLLVEIINEPIFDAQEFKTHVSNAKQKHVINNNKVDFVARNEFAAHLFGEKHPYGVFAKEADYNNLTIDDLKAFYKSNYQNKNTRIVIAGNVNENDEQLFITHFSQLNTSGTNSSFETSKILADSSTKEKVIEKADVMQSALRLGKVLVNKTHPDYHGLQVLNTILGGYFGSRLMSNIREEKGYTYGIGSGIVSLQDSGFFVISTEVGADVCKDAVKEILKEVNRLCTELVGEDELQTVKNYMLGSFLRSIDGTFALADKFNAIHEYNLGFDYYTHFVNTVKSISALELQNLANKYLSTDTLKCLIVGKY